MNVEDMVASTLRLPPEVHEQVVARAKINRRTKNAELITLIEAGLDAGTKSDAELIRSLTQSNRQ